MKNVVLKAALDDFDVESDATGLHCRDKSLTHQSFAPECDINTIVERFGLTGQLPSNVRMPEYADFEGVFDFQSAMNAVVAARESFMEMPAKVRARFHNDPQEFVEFCSDKENRAEAEKLGLVEATKLAAALTPVAQPGAAPVASPPTETKPAAPASGPA